MAERSDIQGRLQSYFRSKGQQLLAAAREVTTDHAGLRGAHREAVLRVFLAGIVPRRFQIGRGMVYGRASRSRESDIVIWDASNYPSLPMHDHNLFFAESVRVVLEVKSRWSAEELRDILDKCRAVHGIFMFKRPGLAEEISQLRLDVTTLLSGEPITMLSEGSRIGTAGIILFGGQGFSLSQSIDTMRTDIEDGWPDVLLLLEAGRVIVKEYVPVEGSFLGGHAYLHSVSAGEDALLVFTSVLLGLLSERAFQVEDPFYLGDYAEEVIRNLPVETEEFPITRPIVGRTFLWGA